MANLCEVYSGLLQNALEALENALTTGQEYSIAGRSKKNFDINELEKLVSKYQALSYRHCENGGKIKTKRVIPLDC